MTASGELALPTGPDPADLPGGRHHGAGEVNTLVDLYRHHQQRIYRYCLALLRNPDDAEDATQETFTRAAPFLPNLPGDLSAYLTTVARNICCDVVRARSRRVVPIDNVPLADRAVSPERQSVDWDVVRRMWRQLSASERLLFAYTFAGYKYEEIASRTGMSRPAVSVGLARARRRLRDLATATGTLALLPAAIRRLVERVSRRASSTLASAQGTVVGLADQIGAIAASILAGLIAAGAPAAVPITASLVAQREPMRTSPALALPPAALAQTGDKHALAGTPSRNATAGAASRAGSHSSIPPLAGPVEGLVPGSNATPQDALVDQNGMTLSPTYETDHTFFVSGEVTGESRDQPQCFALQCPTLFKSVDAGATWTRVGVAYVGGPVVISPAFPTDPVLFADNLEAGGVWESPQGDGIFTLAVPGASAMAMAPDSRAGQARLGVILGLTRVAEYSAATGVLSAPAALPSGFSGGDLAYTSPTTVIVTGSNPQGTQSGWITCSFALATCGPPHWLSSAWNGVLLAPSPDIVSDHIIAIYAYNGTALSQMAISQDGGTTFTPVALSQGMRLWTASIGRGPVGPRLVLGYTDSATDQHAAVLVSDNLGQTFSSYTGDLDNTSVSILDGVAALPNGSVLAALGSDTTGRFALRETTGNGIWTKPS